MGESGIFIFSGEKLADENSVLIKLHAVGVGENIDLADIACRVLADIHGRGDNAAGNVVALACINRGRELRIAEHVHNAVVAYPVAAAEVLMRVVVKHAPREYAADIVGGIHRVEHLRVSERVAEPVPLIVKGLCREHVPVALGNEIRPVLLARHVLFRFQTGIVAGVRKVVVCINILKQPAFFKVPDAARLAAGVECVRNGIRFSVKLVAVLRFVYPDAPQHDRRMVHILPHHFIGVFNRLPLPVLVADMLPAGNFGKHQKSKLVAA